MPITPLHFGINGTVAAISPSRIDIGACIFSNILLDIQPFLVIFFGTNIQLHGISHTLLFAIIASILFFSLYGLAVKKVFNIKKPLSAFILGGVIGSILHIALDSFYHGDVKPFYPFSNINFAHFEVADIIVILGLIGFITFFIFLMIRYFWRRINNST